MRGTAVFYAPAVGRTIPHQTSHGRRSANLEAVAADVWKSLLLTTLKTDSSPRPARFAVSATVPLAGTQMAVAVIRASAEAAAHAAVTLLGLRADELAPGDIDDAFAELAVAVGTRLRSELPGVTRFGTPVVVQGRELSTALPGADQVADVVLSGDHGPVALSLWRPRPARWSFG